MRRIGIMGGTFDPIHMGHLDLARAAADALNLDRVKLLPSHVPPHRGAPGASVFHRFAMVALAAAADARFEADDQELRRAGPSYTAVTLRQTQHQGFAAGEMFFLTGADAFAEIATWKDYPALLDLAHFVVCSRPGRPAEMVRGLLPDLQERMVNATDFDGSVGTKVILLDASTAAVSSSQVRDVLASGAAGSALSGLVAPAVETHIRRHGLYNVPQPTPLH